MMNYSVQSNNPSNERILSMNVICKNCGSTLRDDQRFCPDCGYPTSHGTIMIDSVILPPWIKSDKASPERPAGTVQKDPDQNRPDPPAEDPRITNPFAITGEEILFGEVKEDGYYINDVPAPESSLSDLSPAQTKKTGTGSAKLWVILLSIFAFIGVLCVIGYALNNSPSAKTKKAMELLEQRDYSQAKTLLSDLYTPQAVALKKYIDMADSVKQFIEDLKTDDHSEIRTAFDDIRNALDKITDENEMYYYSDTLQNRYRYYKRAVGFALGYGNNPDIPDDTFWYRLMEVQSVMLAAVKKNQSKDKDGYTFTLQDIQNLIDGTEIYVERLHDIPLDCIEITDTTLEQFWQPNVITTKDGKTVIYLSDNTRQIITTLLECCEDEAKTQQKFIQKQLEKWEMDDNLYMTNPDPSYTSFVGGKLKRISGYSDQCDNADIIVCLVHRDIAYALLTGQTYR